MLIAQISDLHISRDPAFLEARIDTASCLQRAVAAIGRLAPAPDLVIVTGDLADNGDAAEYALIARTLAALEMPVLAIPGNHDAADVMRDCLPEWVPAREPDHASFVVEDHPVRLIGLDTSVAGRSAGALCERRLDWLEGVLGGRAGVPALIFMHHPPLTTGIDAMDRCGLLEGSARFAATVAAHGNVCGILCGHVHRNIQGMVGGSPVRVANSTAHQVALHLASDAPLEYRLEPPCVALHRIDASGAMVSHTLYVDAFPGPWPF